MARKELYERVLQLCEAHDLRSPVSDCWTIKDNTRLMLAYNEGLPYLGEYSICSLLGRDEKPIRCQWWKIVTQYDQDNRTDPPDVMMPIYRDGPWTKRDYKIVALAFGPKSCCKEPSHWAPIVLSRRYEDCQKMFEQLATRRGFGLVDERALIAQAAQKLVGGEGGA